MNAAVKSIDAWPSNAHLIADVARLGYFDADDKGTPGTVFDATFGEGTFWKCWRPHADQFATNDLHKPAMHAADYRALPWPESMFDVVVFDPPYKLNGTPALGEQDERYGTTERTSRQEVLDDIVAGARECYRVCRRTLLVKCMDQVEGGQMRWQTDLVTRAIEDLGGRKVDRFDFESKGRPQPSGRRQLTARHTASQLLVFRKPARRGS